LKFHVSALLRRTPLTRLSPACRSAELPTATYSVGCHQNSTRQPVVYRSSLSSLASSFGANQIQNCITHSALCGDTFLVDCMVRVAQVLACSPLLSSTTTRLMVPTHRLSTTGSRSFPVAGPTVWNHLPTYSCFVASGLSPEAQDSFI